MKRLLSLLLLVITSNLTANLNQDFLKAVKENATTIALDLLEEGADINATDSNDRNALFFATKNGNFSFVEELLERGINTDQQDNHGITPLLFAIQEERIFIASLIALAETDVNLPDYCGNTPLMLAASCGLYSPLPENMRLDEECLNAYKGLTSLLLLKGADPNLKNAIDESPLSIAIEYNVKPIAKLLIYAGSEIPTGETLREEMIEFLEKPQDSVIETTPNVESFLANCIHNDTVSPIGTAISIDFPVWKNIYNEELKTLYLDFLQEMLLLYLSNDNQNVIRMLRRTIKRLPRNILENEFLVGLEARKRIAIEDVNEELKLELEYGMEGRGMNLLLKPLRSIHKAKLLLAEILEVDLPRLLEI